MARQCICKKDYQVTASDYISPRNHSPIYNKTIFQQNIPYWFYNHGDEFYVAPDKKYLKDISRWNTYIEMFNEDEFDEYFYFEKKI